MDSPGGLPARPKSAAILPTNPRPAAFQIRQVGFSKLPSSLAPDPTDASSLERRQSLAVEHSCPFLVSSSKAHSPTQNAHPTQPRVTPGLPCGSPACSHCGHHWQLHLACAAPSTAQHVLRGTVDLLPA